MAYCGLSMKLAKAVGDAAAGGMVGIVTAPECLFYLPSAWKRCHNYVKQQLYMSTRMYHYEKCSSLTSFLGEGRGKERGK